MVGRKVKKLDKSEDTKAGSGVKKEKNTDASSSNIILVENLDESTTQDAIRQTISRRGLNKPQDIRIVRVGDKSSAFLEFGSSTAAVLVMERFQDSLFSDKQNMSLLNLGPKKLRPSLEKAINYVSIYFGSDPKRSVEISTSRGNLTKKFTKLKDLRQCLDNLKSSCDLVAVFVCIKSFEIFTNSCGIMDSCFKGWTDINSLSMNRFDPTYLKHIGEDGTRLAGLYAQHCVQTSDSVLEGAIAVNKIFSTFPSPEKLINFGRLPSSDYLVVVIDIGLVKVSKLSETRSVLGSIGVKGEGFDWSCGLDLSHHTGTVNAQSAAMLGLKQVRKSSMTWVYGTGNLPVPCLSEKPALDQLLKIFESRMSLENTVGGVVMTTILEDDSLAYLTAAMKANGLLKRFMDVVAGFAHLETLFKEKGICKKMFSLKFLEKYTNSILPERRVNLEKEPSGVLAEVGFSALSHILKENLSSQDFIRKFTFPFISGKFNHMLEGSIHKEELIVFDENYCDIKLERGVTLEPGKLLILPLLVVPASSANTNRLFDLSPCWETHSDLYVIKTSKQRSNGSGTILVNVKNITKNKVRLPKGMNFGLVLRLEAEQSSNEKQKIVCRRSIVDIENLKIEPSSDESESAEMLTTDNKLTETPLEKDSKMLSPVAEAVLDMEEMLASNATEFLSNVDILTELTEQLTPGQPSDIPLENWEELNPTFSNFSIDSSLDVADMASLENDVCLDEDIGLAVPSLLDTGEPEDKSPDPGINHPGLSSSQRSPSFANPPVTISTKVDITDNLLTEVITVPVKVDITDLAPLRVSNKIARARESFPLDETKPLVVQLQLIKEKIKNNSVEGDLSDQFPSLIGQDDYLALYETLIKYTGCKLDELDFDFLDFGEKVNSEILNFGMDNLDSFFTEINLLHQKNKDACLQEWVSCFVHRFESLEGINDLNGENFDSMVVQWMVLHYCDKLETSKPKSDINKNVRDMVGYPCFEGFDIVEVEIPHAQDLKGVENKQSLVNNDKESKIDLVSELTSEDNQPDSETTVNEGCDSSIKVKSATVPPNQIGISQIESMIQQPLSVIADAHILNFSNETQLQNKPPGIFVGDVKEKLTLKSQEFLVDIKDDKTLPQPSSLGTAISTSACIEYKTGDVKLDSLEETTTNSPEKQQKIEEIKESLRKSVESPEEMNVNQDEEKQKKNSVEQEEKVVKVLEKSTIQGVESDISKVTEKLVSSLSPTIKEVNCEERSQLPDEEKKENQELRVTEKQVPSEIISTEPETKKSPRKKEKLDSEKILAQSPEKIESQAILKSIAGPEKKDVAESRGPEIKDKKVSSPIDPDEDFCDLYLGVKMESTSSECSVMVFNEDLTANAEFRANNLYVKGKQMKPGDDVDNLLKSNEEDQDIILVYIPNLLKDGVSRGEVAIPLSSWDDGKFFFSGFVLYLEPKDKYCVAFLKGGSIHTAIVPRNKIKYFNAEENLECGLEVKLMVKQRLGRLQSEIGIDYRATLCIPNPEKRFYDLVETTYWAEKTKNHMYDPDTLKDLEESFGSRVEFTAVLEKSRFFLLVRGKDKKSCIDGYNRIKETKTDFEKLPGNRPKHNAALQICMDSVGLRPGQRPSSLNQLQHIAHYTGTTIRLAEEFSIEGYSQPMVELAKKILPYNIDRCNQVQVLVRSAVSTTLSTEKSAPLLTTQKNTASTTQKSTASTSQKSPSLTTEKSTMSSTEKSTTTSTEKSSALTTEKENISNAVSQPSMDDPEVGEVSSTTEGDVTLGLAPVTQPDDDVITVVDDEEETLKQIFYANQHKSQPQTPYIELKLGKNMTLTPGEERSLTLSLKQRLTKKYSIVSHFDFEQFQDRVELVMELINDSNVQIDLKNIGGISVSLMAQQNVVLLEERPTKQKEPERRKAKKSPLLVKKKLPSEGGIKNPASINASLSKASRMGADAAAVPDGISLKRYNVTLLETIDIPGKSVAYAQVSIENGDRDVFNHVHEIIRHPDFKSPAIFIPERQKKKICENEKLHMSIRNRLEESKRLQGGKIVGQIIVQIPASRKRDNDSKHESAQKKRKMSADDGKRISPPPLEPPKVKEAKDKQEQVLALLKQGSTGSGSGLAVSNKVREGSADKLEKEPSRKKSSPGECCHGALKGQACKAALLGNQCNNSQCLSANQHSFSNQFIKLRNKEFCMDYLTQKVCSKSFHPFVCSSKNHVYDVGEICRFYESNLAGSIEACSECNSKVSSTVQKTIITETSGPKKEEKVSSMKKSTSKPPVKEALPETPESTDEIEIIEIDVTEPGLRVQCPHISENPKICPKIGFCSDESCKAAHNLKLVKVKYCAKYLETKSCDNLECEPHLTPDNLQLAYKLALQTAVLNCRKCSFNCKLFNPENRRYRQDRICLKEYTAKCRRKKECTFIHFSEVQHLKMPPPCKTFALKETCPTRATEKGVVHLTHYKYQNNFLAILKKNDRKCSMCQTELKKLQEDFDCKVKDKGALTLIKVNLTHSSDKLTEGSICKLEGNSTTDVQGSSSISNKTSIFQPKPLDDLTKPQSNRKLPSPVPCTSDHGGRLLIPKSKQATASSTVIPKDKDSFQVVHTSIKEVKSSTIDKADHNQPNLSSCTNITPKENIVQPKAVVEPVLSLPQPSKPKVNQDTGSSKPPDVEPAVTSQPPDEHPAVTGSSKPTGVPQAGTSKPPDEHPAVTGSSKPTGVPQAGTSKPPAASSFQTSNPKVETVEATRPLPVPKFGSSAKMAVDSSNSLLVRDAPKPIEAVKVPAVDAVAPAQVVSQPETAPTLGTSRPAETTVVSSPLSSTAAVISTAGSSQQTLTSTSSLQSSKPPVATLVETPQPPLSPVVGTPQSPVATVAGTSQPQVAPVLGTPQPPVATVVGKPQPQVATVDSKPQLPVAPVVGTPKSPDAPVPGKPQPPVAPGTSQPSVASSVKPVQGAQISSGTAVAQSQSRPSSSLGQISAQRRSLDTRKFSSRDAPHQHRNQAGGITPRDRYNEDRHLKHHARSGTSASSKPSSSTAAPLPGSRKRRVCPFYGTPKKCVRGYQCWDIHDLSTRPCKFWVAGHCSLGNRCSRKHSQ